MYLYIGMVPGSLWTISTIFRASARFNRYQAADLYFRIVIVSAMYACRFKNEVKKGTIVDLSYFFGRPVISYLHWIGVVGANLSNQPIHGTDGKADVNKKQRQQRAVENYCGTK
jgi:hypothetical protein